MAKVSQIAAEQYNKMKKLWNGTKVNEITITAADWTSSDSDSFNYEIDVTVAGITTETEVAVKIKKDDLDIASEANVSIIVERAEDTLTFYADKIPSNDITAYYKVV